MNKLYLLAALFASVFADPTECDSTYEELEDDDFLYMFTLDLSFDDSTEYNDDADDGTTADVAYDVCYMDFITNFIVDSVEVLDADGADGTDTEDDLYLYGYLSESDDDSDITFDDVTPTDEEAVQDLYTAITDADETTDPFEGGILDIGQDVYSLVEGDGEDEGALSYGVRLFYVWAGVTTGDTATVTGYSNNAVFQAASAFTVAAVAGLFF